MDLPYHNCTLDGVDCVVYGLGVVCYPASVGGTRSELLLANFVLRTHLVNVQYRTLPASPPCELRASTHRR
jgi:hypothetical protein